MPRQARILAKHPVYRQDGVRTLAIRVATSGATSSSRRRFRVTFIRAETTEKACSCTGCTISTSCAIGARRWPELDHLHRMAEKSPLRDATGIRSEAPTWSSRSRSTVGRDDVPDAARQAPLLAEESGSGPVRRHAVERSPTAVWSRLRQATRHRARAGLSARLDQPAVAQRVEDVLRPVLRS